MRPMTQLFATATFLSYMVAFSVLAQSTTSSGSSVRIVSISPEVSKPLYVGEKQRIAVEVEYVMAQDSGTITLVIQKGESGGSPLGNVTEVVSKGKGKLKLEAEIQIPETRAIQVFTPLSHQGDAGTSIVDVRAFKVTKR